MTGTGWGTAKNVRDATGLIGTSDLGLNLGMVDASRVIETAGGIECKARADMAWAQLATADGAETVDAQRAAVQQVRIGTEISSSVGFANGVLLTRFGEMHVRYDRGSSQTGTGLEVLAGTRLVRGKMQLDVQGRLLTLHSAAGYQERGIGMTFGVDNPSQVGPSLSASLRWGDVETGGATLWQERSYARYSTERNQPWKLNAHSEYGIRLRRGALVSVRNYVCGPPFGETGLGSPIPAIVSSVLKRANRVPAPCAE